jgi:hypothetical protein
MPHVHIPISVRARAGSGSDEQVRDSRELLGPIEQRRSEILVKRSGRWLDLDRLAPHTT